MWQPELATMTKKNLSQRPCVCPTDLSHNSNNGINGLLRLSHCPKP
jgi:hypothetical protein